MGLRFMAGVRIGPLTIDPQSSVEAALWTHRPARRRRATRTMAATPLAESWRNAAAVPFHGSAVAFGHRFELLPTGYGLGGAAVLLTQKGRRTLVVGPTAEALRPRPADLLVLAAPEPLEPAGAWLLAARCGTRLWAPDGAALEALAQQLEHEDIMYRGPQWLTGTRRNGVQLHLGVPRGALRTDALKVDLRPQASEAWLVEFAQQVGPGLVQVHGPRAEALAEALSKAGLNTQMLHTTAQLGFHTLSDPDPGV